MRFSLMYIFIFLFLLGSFVGAENIIDEQDLSCSVAEDCRVTSCGNCVNSNQEETRFCAKPEGDMPYSISCSCENRKCASMKINKTKACVENDGLCCKDGVVPCTISNIMCPKDTVYSFKGCDGECMPIVECAVVSNMFNLSNGRVAEIKIMPETASERAIERLGELNFTVELKEVGKGNETRVVYEIKSEKEGKLFGLFKIKANVSVEIDAEGNVKEFSDPRIKKPWWAFLASGI